MSDSHRSGLRAHLYHLLPIPRHALFHVRVHIHQLHNVPLIRGEFAAKWKFQNVHSVNTSGILAIPSPTHTPRELDRHKHHHNPDDPVDSAGEDDSTSLPDARPPTVTSHSSSSNRSLVSDQLSTSSHSSSHSFPPPSPNPTATTLFSDSQHRPVEIKADARGRTEYLPLREHNVKWDHTIDVGVQMSVHRETRDLLPSDLKVVVMQRVIPGDPDAPKNPRLGAVYLNLAEYVDVGPVERRYLLRESKTNATLQMTIELRHMGGEKIYHAPPLQKGEVMARVTGLLQRDAMLSVGGAETYRYSQIGRRQAPRAGGNHNLNLNPSQTGHQGRDRAVPIDRSRSSLSQGSSQIAQNGDGQGSMRRTSSGGLTETDNIIEAIFNPVPTTSTAASPFTYYVPPRPVRGGGAPSVSSAGSGGEWRVQPPSPRGSDVSRGEGTDRDQDRYLDEGDGDGESADEHAASSVTTHSSTHSQTHAARRPTQSTRFLHPHLHLNLPEPHWSHSSASPSASPGLATGGEATSARRWWRKLGRSPGVGDGASSAASMIAQKSPCGRDGDDAYLYTPTPTPRPVSADPRRPSLDQPASPRVGQPKRRSLDYARPAREKDREGSGGQRLDVPAWTIGGEMSRSGRRGGRRSVDMEVDVDLETPQLPIHGAHSLTPAQDTPRTAPPAFLAQVDSPRGGLRFRGGSPGVGLSPGASPVSIGSPSPGLSPGASPLSVGGGTERVRRVW